MKKQILIGWIAIYVLLSVLDMIVHGVILSEAYAAMPNVWRSDMMEKMWMIWVVRAITTFFIAFIFAKGYEGKGWMEGLRYGVYIGLLMATPYAYGSYASYPIPYAVAVQWFIYAFVGYVLAGITLALIFGRKTGAST